MKRAFILYNEYVNEKHEITIGGIQTYIADLADVLIDLGWSVAVYQYGSHDYSIHTDGYEIVEVGNASRPSDLLSAIDKMDPNYQKDILVFATDFMIVKNRFANSIALQHGIAWDITQDAEAGDLKNYVAILKNALRAAVKYRRYKYISTMVCVDYNFVNWYRTQVAHVGVHVEVIPNYASITEDVKEEKNKSVSVVFARRLVEHRGTHLFVEAILPVLEKYPDLKVTIAGTGPDEGWMKEKLSSYKDVHFTSFKAGESIDFHKQFDIAVVPTKGSEGTSLSLLEAMSAGCAVIATNIGGMTNIILDEYNGLMISPDVNELKAAIVHLIENKELRAFLSRKAQETVRKSFSYEKWKNSWIKVIQAIEKE